MFEMLVTVVAAAIAAIYGFSRSVFFNGPNQFFYRCILAGVVFVLGTFLFLRRAIRHANIRDLHVDLESYLYYDQFTTPLYRIGYFLSYLVQNLLFDYTYMKRNFNFCKGLDVYDDGVSEYYIKFRNTWYKYIPLTFKRHRISMKKLAAFSANMKNEMIFKALETEEERLITLAFEQQVKDYYDEHKRITMPIIKALPLYKEVNKYYSRHIYTVYNTKMYVSEHESEIVNLVNIQDFRSKRDINDFKKMKMNDN